MEIALVLTEIRDGHRVVTLQRSDRLNAFNAELHAAGHFAAQPTAGLALIKQARDASDSNSLDQQFDLECKLQVLWRFERSGSRFA
ncbi:MAG TPA: hypothetical protein VGC77_00675 [Rhodopseudomonas sp.]|uniref:hypothetical protein n=1 Tax=Rhodopseudomonas sp. TaxID=1078 RepID=UPI002ED8C584